MTQYNQPAADHFTVRTGLIEFVVQATDRVSAIAAFRKRLCAEHPRLWDLIVGIDDARIEVVDAAGRTHEAA